MSKQSRPAVLQPGAGRCGGLSAPANLRPQRARGFSGAVAPDLVLQLLPPSRLWSFPEYAETRGGGRVELRLAVVQLRKCVFCVVAGGGVLELQPWRPASSGPLNHPTCAPSSLRKTSIMAEDNTQLQPVLSVSSVYLSNYSISPATLLFFFPLLSSCHIRVPFHVRCGDLFRGLWKEETGKVPFSSLWFIRWTT